MYELIITITVVPELLQTYYPICPICDISIFAYSLLSSTYFIGFFFMILLLDFIFAWSLIVFDLIFFTKTTNSSSAATPAQDNPPAATPAQDNPPAATPAQDNPPAASKPQDNPPAATPAPEEPRAVEKPRGRTYYGRKAKILKTAPDVSLRRALFPPGT